MPEMFYWGLYHDGDVLWKQYSEMQRDPAAKCQEHNPSIAFSRAQWFSPWTWHPWLYTKPDDISECLPTDPHRFRVNAGSPRSSVISQPAFIQMSGEVTRSGLQIWKHWGQNSFQSGEIEQKSIWPYLETRERRGGAGQEPTCVWTESVWCFADMGRNASWDPRRSPGWMSCYSSRFRIKAQFSQESHVLTQMGQWNKPVLLSVYQASSRLFLSLHSWDLQFWEVMSMFPTPGKNQLRVLLAWVVLAASLGGLGKLLTQTLLLFL